MKTKCFLPVWLLFFFTSISYAQITVSGKVTDAQDGQPLIGAIVKSESDRNAVVTDEKGHFQLSSDSSCRYLIIRYLGYTEKRIDLSNWTGDQLWIKMERSNTTLDEVIVSAATENFKRTVKGSNFRVSPATLRNINPISTEEVLRTVPGVNIIGDMGLSNRPNISIRGSWGRRSKKVLLLEDGTPSAPAPYIAPGAYYNPVSDRIMAIEVYKGADLLRFGPNNMYGAVNYITALPPQKPELRLKLIGGQRNYQTGLLSYGGTWNNLGALVEGVYKKFDGFTDNSSVEILNLNAKIFAKLSENQSLYFKVSGQYEDNQASLSSQTPFTFESDPEQNPFDADQFTMRRYGVDIIHKWLPKKNLSIISKIYASDFERDWWRQITAKVKASEVKAYVGEDIYNDRYSYLNSRSFGQEDYVIVGRIRDGRESASDSRWVYTVAGFKENIHLKWEAFGKEQNLEAGANFHRETFSDVNLIADSSRWARSGRTTTDLWYRLWAVNGFIKNEFDLGRWHVTPILRLEHVDMYRQDLLAISQNPDIQDTEHGRESNAFTQFLPGITLEYQIPSGQIYASMYQGMIAPSKVFGFLVERDGVISNPLAGESINIDPELSWNREIGWRGKLLNERIDGQLTYFNNTSRNFYAGGRNEVFQKLGKINVQGVELAMVSRLLSRRDHHIRLTANVNYMHSKILEGSLVDRDLFSQIIHSTATVEEYTDKVNANRSAFDVYVSDGAGGDILLERNTIDESDFPDIIKSVIHFGNSGIRNGKAPYTPEWNSSIGLVYEFRDLTAGVSGHFVSEQFTEFHNFIAESADGAIGKLPAYYSVDAFVNYDFSFGNSGKATAFINGKNITNDIYRASRLNRATSGLFAGGFRQIIFGLNLNF